MVPRFVPLLRLQIARAGAAMGTALRTVISQTVAVHVHAARHTVLGAGQIILTLRQLLITGVEQSAVKEKSMNGLAKNRCIKKCTGKDIHNVTDDPCPRDTVTTTAENRWIRTRSCRTRVSYGRRSGPIRFFVRLDQRSNERHF